MKKSDPKQARASASLSREERLAQALRQNLKRRKTAAPAQAPDGEPQG